VAVLRGGEANRTIVARVAEQACLRTGHDWLPFNEPDLEGQDRVSEQVLARCNCCFRYPGMAHFDHLEWPTREHE